MYNSRMEGQFKCEDCEMAFDKEETYNKHKEKFCINSQYANIDSLNQHFASISKGKDISMHGRPQVAQKGKRFNLDKSTVSDNSEMGQEYKELLRQIGQREDLKLQVDRQKIKAEEELMNLEKRERGLVVEAKRQDLVDVLRKRDNLMKEEEQLQKQIKAFERERKDESRVKKGQIDDDFNYREGRQAGRLAMQRRILEEKKRDLEANIRGKKKEEDQVNRQLDRIKDIPIYVTDFNQSSVVRQVSSPVPIKQSFLPSPQRGIKETSIPVRNTIKQTYPSQNQRSIKETVAPARNKIKQTYASQNQRSLKETVAPVRNTIKHTYIPQAPWPDTNKQSEVTQKSQLSAAFEEAKNGLDPNQFSGQERTLFESLNTKNKTDEDIFIESLITQQYDALNVIARLPKDSDLYHLKVKQFMQMSKMRQEAKEKLQNVRMHKVKKQLDLFKMNAQSEKSNLQWLDRNRKEKLTNKRQALQQRNMEEQIAEHQQQPRVIHHGDAFNTNYIPDEFNPMDNPNIMLKTNENQKHHRHLQHRQLQQRRPYQQYEQHRQQQQYQHSIQGQKHSYGAGPAVQPSMIPGSRGHQITIRSVRNYNNKGPMSVKLALMQQSQPEPRWIFSTKYHDDYAAAEDRNPFNPSTKNRRNAAGDILFGESFEIREDLQALYNRNQEDIFLWIMLQEKDEQKMSMEPQVKTWYCFKLTHFGQIREGNYTVNLYTGTLPFPDSIDMNRVRGKTEEQVTFQLLETVLGAPKPPTPQPRLRTMQNQARRTPQNRLIEPDIPQSTQGKIRRDTQNSHQPRKLQIITPRIEGHLEDLSQKFYISNEGKAECLATNKVDEIFLTVAIGGARFLPTHCGPIRLQVSFLDSSNQMVLGKEEVMGQLGNDIYNPQIDYTRHLKGQILPASVIMLVRIMTISSLNYESGLLGFSILHLFYDREGQPIEKEGSKNHYLLTGQFQLPIFWGMTNNYVSMEDLHTQHPQMPCASLLVSLSPNESKVASKMSVYSTGAYNTCFFSLPPLHYRFFQEQAKRQRVDTDDFFQGFMKNKNLKGYSSNQLRKLLNKTMAFNEQNCDNLLIMASMGQYNPSFGVVVGIDIIKVPNTTLNYYYFCTACMSPPAYYYEQKQNDLAFKYLIDLGSLSKELLLRDQETFFNPPADQNAAIIIQLLRVKIGENGKAESSIQSCGYGVVPVFDLDLQFSCVDVRIEAARLWDGDFPSKELKRVKRDLKDYLTQSRGRPKTEFEIMLRVMNGFFPNQLQGPKTSSRGRSLRTIFQNSKGFKTAQDGVRKLIESTYGIRL